MSLYRTALRRNHKHDNKTTKMRWFSLLTGRKTKAYKKVLKVEEKRHMRARGAPWSHRTRGRGVCTSRLVALSVLIMSTDTISSVAITFLLRLALLKSSFDHEGERGRRAAPEPRSLKLSGVSFCYLVDASSGFFGLFGSAASELS
jgi:hypothetical protein